MQVVQIPEERTVFAVDFKSVERLVAAGVTGRFEGGERTVAESREERTRVVDGRPFPSCR